MRLNLIQPAKLVPNPFIESLVGFLADPVTTRLPKRPNPSDPAKDGYSLGELCEGAVGCVSALNAETGQFVPEADNSSSLKDIYKNRA